MLKGAVRAGARTCLLELLDLGLAQALDVCQVLLARERHSLHCVNACLSELLDVCSWNALLLQVEKGQVVLQALLCMLRRRGFFPEPPSPPGR